MSDHDDLLRRAGQVLPGGILGSHRSGPGLEFVVKEGKGGYLYDMAGRRYLDYLLVRDGDNLRIAFVGTQPTGSDRYDVRYMITRSDEAEIKRSDVAGRLCRPGSSVPRY